jgi:hypothetical protein
MSFSLPKELLVHIFEYNADHREKFIEVLSELLDYVNYTTCYNDMCEQEMHLLHDQIYTDNIAGINYNFCSDYCLSYGSWSIRYDLRKRNRRINSNL